MNHKEKVETSSLKVAVIIMASGYSRRIGNNKLLMSIENLPIIGQTLNKVNLLVNAKKVIVLRDEKVMEIAKEYKDIAIIKNERADIGVSESIKLGTKWAVGQNADGYLFLPGDQVGITVNVLKYLIEAFYKTPSKIIVPIYKDIAGSPVIFPTQYKDQLLELSGDTGGKRIWTRNTHDVREVVIKDAWANFDLDTMEDYEKIVKKMGK